MENNNQLKENAEKATRIEKYIQSASENCKNTENILENKKISFKCNLETDLKLLRKRKIRKIVVGQIRIYSTRNKFDPIWNNDILSVTVTKINSEFSVSLFYFDGYNVHNRHGK